MAENSSIFLYFELEQPIYPTEFSKKWLDACLSHKRPLRFYVCIRRLSVINAPHDNCSSSGIVK